MKVLVPGHQYALDNFEDPATTPAQWLKFIQKEKIDGSTELVTVCNGTTTEEVLEMLIDRSKYLFNKFPSKETAVAITKMEEALLWLEKRTRDRIKRNVEGRYLS